MKLAKNITRISVKSMASACVLALVLGLASQQAAALGSTTYGFYNITHTNTINEANGETNLKVEVIELTNLNQVRFKFTNNSTSSSLTDVYFDDGTLLGISSIYDSGDGVSFSQGASPKNLPGGENVTPPFKVTKDFSADSNKSVTENGVSMNEWLAIDFNLINGKTYDNVLSALALPNNGGDGDLRIGVRVQNVADDDDSESFINESTVSPVPEANAWAMMVAGLGLVGFMARRKRYEAA